MRKEQTLGEVLAAKGVSRRGFMKFVAATTSLMALPPAMIPRVAKALETYDSVMVRRDLEADGGFAEFFKRSGDGTPAEALAAERAQAHGLVDDMGQLQQRVPLVGKVPPWKQPKVPEDPDAPKPFEWLREGEDAPSVPAPVSVPPNGAGDGRSYRTDRPDLGAHPSTVADLSEIFTKIFPQGT